MSSRIGLILARHQAYTHALRVLTDRVGFPDDQGNRQDTPEGCERRNP
jgi:hypothetical protein